MHFVLSSERKLTDISNVSGSVNAVKTNEYT
jgi:hypothetical protein